MKSYLFDHNYNFCIKEINFVLERTPNKDWKIDGIINRNYFILAFCNKGISHYYFNNHEHQINQGDLLLFEKGVSHSAYSDPDNPWEFYTVQFDIQFFNPVSEENFQQLSNIISSSNPFEYSALFTKLNHMWTGKKQGYLIKCRSILLEILYQMIRENSFNDYKMNHTIPIEEIMNYIQDNYQKTFSIEQLANQTQFSTSHFRVIFKKVTGYTVLQYQNHIKISKAKDLLLSGEYNVSEVATLVGFGNVYYFSRLFKKTTGFNPSSYIQK
ncbi:AraC family transcriptional regulator [Gracilibacillus kekensis]|uniref:AraC-type DNA-binding protein n=1 Tax=Gracilibacillus kekensis TaxID=1027249 RepID=A0A1M7QT38_9BACI|nr:AraC family transcriptional regulator [Gracilibacillus kekensis]SHN34876.1 AraC-type DNA-binding protein [Gracilibacillus kekensis]